MLYLIGETADGPLKIGKSKDPLKRLEHLQTANAYRLVLLHTAVCCYDDPACGLPIDDHSAEMLLHSAFQNRRIGGEWFRVSVEQVLEKMYLTAADVCESLSIRHMQRIETVTGKLRSPQDIWFCFDWT